MDPHSASGGGDFHRDPADAINASTACYLGASDVRAAVGHEQSLADADAIAYYCAVLDSATDECRPPVDCLARAEARRERVM